MEKHHDRRGNLLLALAALTLMLIMCLLIWRGLRENRGHLAYADAVLVAAPQEVRRHEI